MALGCPLTSRCGAHVSEKIDDLLTKHRCCTLNSFKQLFTYYSAALTKSLLSLPDRCHWSCQPACPCPAKSQYGRGISIFSHTACLLCTQGEITSPASRKRAPFQTALLLLASSQTIVHLFSYVSFPFSFSQVIFQGSCSLSHLCFCPVPAVLVFVTHAHTNTVVTGGAPRRQWSWT